MPGQVLLSRLYSKTLSFQTDCYFHEHGTCCLTDCPQVYAGNGDISLVIRLLPLDPLNNMAPYQVNTLLWPILHPDIKLLAVFL